MALDAEEEDEEEVKKAAGAILKLHAPRPSRPSVRRSVSVQQVDIVAVILLT